MEKLTFITVKKYCEFETEKIKGSRFTGRILRVDSAVCAESEIANMKKRFFDATHNCYAYTVGLSGNAAGRFSDDGEPSGTAGKPIMTVLENSGLSNALIIVTRYYGGTNLGTGGLIRAYTEAAAGVIGKAEKETVEITSELEFGYSYEQTNLVMNLISRYGASVISEDFGNGPVLRISLNRGYSGGFISELYERSSGKIRAAECC